MIFEKPSVEFIEFDASIVASTGSSEPGFIVCEGNVPGNWFDCTEDGSSDWRDGCEDAAND